MIKRPSLCKQVAKQHPLEDYSDSSAFALELKIELRSFYRRIKKPGFPKPDLILDKKYYWKKNTVRKHFHTEQNY